MDEKKVAAFKPPYSGSDVHLILQSIIEDCCSEYEVDCLGALLVELSGLNGVAWDRLVSEAEKLKRFSFLRGK